jgi:hypothetical protein
MPCCGEQSLDHEENAEAGKNELPAQDNHSSHWTRGRALSCGRLKHSQIEGRVDITLSLGNLLMSPLSKAMREKILCREGALTEDEAAAFVGAKTLAQFRRWCEADMICGPIPGTKLWNRDDLYRSIAQLGPGAESSPLKE